MVFQKPNPFPKSIYDNIAYGPRVTGMKVDNMDDLVEEALQGAALWDEVKDKLKQSAYGLSGGQQQRLCIARTIATKPDVILMDEPCSALDPIATARVEDLMLELRDKYTIIVVTHNMQQAARVSDRTAFFTARPDETTGNRTGLLVEYDLTSTIFSTPERQAHRGLHLRSLRLIRRRPDCSGWCRASWPSIGGSVARASWTTPPPSDCPGAPLRHTKSNAWIAGHPNRHVWLRLRMTLPAAAGRRGRT